MADDDLFAQIQSLGEPSSQPVRGLPVRSPAATERAGRTQTGGDELFSQVQSMAPKQAKQPAAQEDSGILQALANNPIIRRLNEFGSGITRGAAKMADLPGRAAYGLIPGVEAPGGGFFEQGAADLGMTSEPTDRTGRYIQRAGEDLGASAIPVGAMLGLASRAGTQALGNLSGTVGQAIRNTVQGVARAPGVFAAGEAGMAVASGVGAQAAKEKFPGSTAAEMAGALSPSVAMGLGSAAVRATFRGGEAGRQSVEDAVDTFAEAGTTPTVGQATQKKTAQWFENLIGNFPGGSRIRDFADQVDADIGARVNQVTQAMTRNASAEQAGRTIQRGITGEGGFVGRFKATAKGLYDRLDSQIPGQKIVDVSNTRATLERMSAPIEGAENLSGILASPRIREISGAFLRDTEGGNLPYSALKALRTAVGEKLSTVGLIDDVPRGQLKQLYGALAEDMAGAARAQGARATRAFRRANRYYGAGIKRIGEVLSRVSRKVDPEDIFRAATRGKEGGFTVRTVMRSLRPDERSVVTGSIVNRLGRSTPGQQDELGEAFSPETFLTNWNRLSVEAKRALFDWPQYGGMRKSIDKIAKATATLRDSRRSGSNPSGTGAIVSQIGAYGLLGGGLLNLNLGATGGAIVAIGSANLSARLMTSPRFVKWLARSTEVSVKQIPQHLARLTKIASEEGPATAEAIQEYVKVFQTPTPEQAPGQRTE